MPIVEIELNNGTKKRVELSDGFTDSDVDEVAAQLNSQLPTETKQQPKGVDITPAGLFKGSQNVVASAIAAPSVAKRDKISLKDAYSKNLDKVRQYRKDNPTPVQDFLIDTAAYSLIPQSKAVAPVARFASNVARYGTLPGALEGLKNGKPLGGAAIGTGLTVGLLGGVPIVGKVAKGTYNLGKKVALNSFPGLKEQTVKQLIKPGSKALEMTDDTVQQELLDLTKNVRKNYQDVLTEKGNQVGRLLAELPEEQTFRAGDILQDYDKIYNNYSLSNNPALNPARNATTKELYKIEDLLQGKNAGTLNADNNPVTPKELYDINKNISNMVDWNKADSALKNDVLEQMYGANAERISNLSPELKEANKAYSDLMDFQKNDAIRQILRGDLVSGENLGNAPSALRNYKGNIGSGAKRENIQELEKILVNEGYEPFLEKIDDINAANELLKTAENGFNPLGLTDKIKLMERPILKAARAYNSSQLPAMLSGAAEKIKPGLDWLGGVARRVVPSAAVSMPIYGGIEYNTYQ